MTVCGGAISCFHGQLNFFDDCQNIGAYVKASERQIRGQPALRLVKEFVLQDRDFARRRTSGLDTFLNVRCIF